MVNNQLLEYVKQQLSFNVAKETIISNLKSQGWTDIDIGEAFHALELSTIAPVVPVTPVVPSPAVPSIAQATPSTISAATPLATTMPHMTATYPEYAGFWRRFVASLVDSSLIGLLMLILAVLMTLVGLTNEILIQVVPIILSLLYPVWLESSKWQGTIGKHLMGLKVTDASGNRISFLRALGRNLAKIISAIPLMIGFIMAGFTAKKQGLHDMMAGTLVVKEKPARTGLVLLSIFGPFILFIIAIVMFASMIMGMLGFGLGSMFGGSNSPSIFSGGFESVKDSKNTNTMGLRPIDESSSLTMGTMTKAEYDTFFSNLSMKDWNLQEPGAYVGPSLMIMGFEGGQAEVGFLMPEEFGEKLGSNYEARVTFDNVYTVNNINVFDSDNSFEGDFFINEQLDRKTDNDDNVYYYYSREVHLVDDQDLEYKDFDRATGSLIFELPTSDNMIYTKVYPFEIKTAYKKYDVLAQCINTSGAKFYGASWCEHCQSQKDLFGPSAQYLPYVECADDSDNQLKVCKTAKIESYPTWVFKDNSRLVGGQDFETLAEKTECTLPQ